MFESVPGRWQQLWRSVSHFALAMDTDPLQDIHSRLRRLEGAVFNVPTPIDPAGAILPARDAPDSRSL